VRDIRVAIAQINCPWGELQQNAKKHREFCERAAEQGVEIICFPEMSLTGYPCTASIPHEMAQPLNGDLGQAMARAAADTGMTVLAGMLERDRAGVLYNTELVASPSGAISGYRKAHVANTEIHLYSHGDALPLFTHDGITFGIQICYDNHFPEGSRVLALRGAEILFCPYGSPGPNTLEGMQAKRSRWLKYLTARAFDNSIYVLAVNQVGSGRPAGAENASEPATHSSARDTHENLREFPGGSLVLNPWGELIAEPKPLVDDLLVVDLTQAEFLSKRADALQFFTHFRRPELYADIIQPSVAPNETVVVEGERSGVLRSVARV
jgi:predicted amidohydrolase